jgi:hypothetical protein
MLVITSTTIYNNFKQLGQIRTVMVFKKHLHSDVAVFLLAKNC